MRVSQGHPFDREPLPRRVGNRRDLREMRQRKSATQSLQWVEIQYKAISSESQT